jgi:hypothetical protein
MTDHRKMFTLYLIESDDGSVRVVTDYSGDGDRCLSLGVEIMQSLAMIQPHTGGALSFVMPCQTDLEH